MPQASEKRQLLLQAAKGLIHEQGFTETTLADIATRSGVALGNVYYYFKTKDSLAEAVIDTRADELRQLREHCDQHPQPKQRLLCMIDSLRDHWSEQTVAYGCPAGSLCQELNKVAGPLKQQADQLLLGHLAWLEQQFQSMNCVPGREYAFQFMAMVQGGSLLANTFQNSTILLGRLDELRQWLESL